MSAYPNLFEVLDDNGDAIAQEIDRKSKIVFKEDPALKKKEAPKKEEKKPDLTNQKASDGFEVKGQNRPPRQPKAEKTSPALPQASGRGRGRGRGDRPPRAEGDLAPRRQDGEPRPPRGDRPRFDRPPRQEGDGYHQRDGEQRPPRRERAPRQDGEERPPRQDGDYPRRRPYQPRQDGEERPPRQEGDQSHDNNGEENRPRQYRERRDYDPNRAPREANDESGERRYNNEDRPPRGRGGRGGRGRGNYGNRGPSDNINDLTEGAPIESEGGQRYHRHVREERLSEEKGFVQPKQRAYERRSGTGRTGDDVKRSGRGPNNWGGVGEEALDYAANVGFERPADNEATPAESEAPQVDEEAPAAVQTDVKDNRTEEEITRTLKEYRESQEKDLAQIELPKPRQAGEDSKDKWNNCKVLRKDDLNLKLSVVAPTKEKKKATETKETQKTETSTPKTKSRGNKVPVEQVFKIKAEPRVDTRRRDPRDKPSEPAPKKQAQTPVAAPAKIDKNSKEDFPALAPVKN